MCHRVRRLATLNESRFIGICQHHTFQLYWNDIVFLLAPYEFQKLTNQLRQKSKRLTHTDSFIDVTIHTCKLTFTAESFEQFARLILIAWKQFNQATVDIIPNQPTKKVTHFFSVN